MEWKIKNKTCKWQRTDIIRHTHLRIPQELPHIFWHIKQLSILSNYHYESIKSLNIKPNNHDIVLVRNHPMQKTKQNKMYLQNIKNKKISKWTPKQNGKNP